MDHHSSLQFPTWQPSFNSNNKNFIRYLGVVVKELCMYVCMCVELLVYVTTYLH